MLDVAAKGGAAGCLGVAIRDRYGVAAKSWDGSYQVAAVAAVAALDEMGVLGGPPGSVLKRMVPPDVVGGGRPVGKLESRLELNFQRRQVTSSRKIGLETCEHSPVDKACGKPRFLLVSLTRPPITHQIGIYKMG